MNNQTSFRQRLADGATVTGMLLFTGSPMVVEMMAAAGLDFVIIDMEHSALDLDRAGHLIRAADAAQITPFVRVPEVDAPLIKKLLNLGAAGIVLPHANRENCAALLKAMRFAPDGERGACQITRAAGYVRGGWNEYATRVNRELMAIALLEEKESIADLDALAALLADGGPALECLKLANNETGTLQPVQLAAEVCRSAGALLHVDAVQAAGRVPIDLRALGAHSLALSAHKLGGPKGAGALLLAEEHTALAALISGGGQERGRRGGTPPLPAIAGFAAAADAVSDRSQLTALRDAIERAAFAAGGIVLASGAPRLDNTICLALPGIRADQQVIALDLEGFAVSAGAACSSGKMAESHVLAAMGLGTLANQSIRISLPWNVLPEDVAACLPAYARMAERLGATQPLSPRAA